MEVAHLEQPDDGIWLGFGLIAQQYVETNVSRQDFQRISAPKPTETVADSVWTLAQRRLKMLEENVDRSKTLIGSN